MCSDSNAEGSYHSVLEKNFIRSDGPYLIRLKKPPSKEGQLESNTGNSISDKKNNSFTINDNNQGDEFNRDVTNATSMMVNLIANNNDAKENPEQEEYGENFEEEIEEGADQEYMDYNGNIRTSKGDLVVPQFNRGSLMPTSKEDPKLRAGFSNSNLETPNNRQGFVYSPILSKRAGLGFMGGFMPFSPSNPNTMTAGKKAGFQVNQQNPIIGNQQNVTSRMDKTILHLKDKIAKGNR